MNSNIKKKTDLLVNPGILLAISGILIYKGLGHLESLIGRLLFLLFPKKPIITLYYSHIFDLLIIGGIGWLVVLTIKKKRIGLIDRLEPRFLKILIFSFLAIIIVQTLVSFFSDDYFSNTIGEYMEESGVPLGDIITSHQVFTSILRMITGALVLILFFLNIPKRERKTLYEWPIVSKNEHVVPTSMESDLSVTAANPQELSYDEGQENYYTEDAIYFQDNTCALIWGDSSEGYTITETIGVNEMPNQQEVVWAHLSPTLEATDGKLIALAGETTWGGAGFIGLKEPESESFIWLIHLSTMNNPVSLTFKDSIIKVKTDLNYPHGVLYTVPANAPENFTIKILTEEDSTLS